MSIERDPPVAEVLPTPRLRAGFATRIFDIILRLRAVVALVLLLILFSASTPAFLTANNLTDVYKRQSLRIGRRLAGGNRAGILEFARGARKTQPRFASFRAANVRD